MMKEKEQAMGRRENKGKKYLNYEERDARVKERNYGSCDAINKLNIKYNKLMNVT